jgi:hypothetical protein
VDELVDADRIAILSVIFDMVVVVLGMRVVEVANHTCATTFHCDVCVFGQNHIACTVRGRYSSSRYLHSSSDNCTVSASRI